MAAAATRLPRVPADKSVFEGIKSAIVADRYAYFTDFFDNFYNTDLLELLQH